MRLLEERLDAVAYRIGLAPSIWSARQLVGHGHILVDGKRVNIPSYQVRPGQTVALSERIKKSEQISVWRARRHRRAGLSRGERRRYERQAGARAGTGRDPGAGR